MKASISYSSYKCWLMKNFKLRFVSNTLGKALKSVFSMTNSDSTFRVDLIRIVLRASFSNPDCILELLLCLEMAVTHLQSGHFWHQISAFRIPYKDHFFEHQLFLIKRIGCEIVICKGTRNDKDLLTVKFGSTHLRDP